MNLFDLEPYAPRRVKRAAGYVIVIGMMVFPVATSHFIEAQASSYGAEIEHKMLTWFLPSLPHSTVPRRAPVERDPRARDRAHDRQRDDHRAEREPKRGL